MKKQRVALAILTCTICLLVCCKKNNNIPAEETETVPATMTAHTVNVNDQINGYYSALPSHYLENNNTYPLLIWLHGYGQVGNGANELPKVLYGGIPKLLNEKSFPPSFTVKGRRYSFIILCPQYNGFLAIDRVASFIGYAKTHYRVDVSRIYLSGLSMGGIVTADFAAGYGSEMAAVVPISGVSVAGDVAVKCSQIAASGVPLWAFQNTSDDVFNVENARSFITLLKTFKSTGEVKYTELLPFGENGHDAWTMATDPSYKEKNMNIYEWMLQFHR